MGSLRALFRQRPGLLAFGIALALLMKAWVPTGYMPVAGAGGLLLQPCDGRGVMMMPLAASGDHASGDHMAMPMDASHGNHGDHGVQHLDMPCAFAGLSMPALMAVDALLLAAAIAFLYLAALSLPVTIILRRIAYLRPPAQAPPALS